WAGRPVGGTSQKSSRPWMNGARASRARALPLRAPRRRALMIAGPLVACSPRRPPAGLPAMAETIFSKILRGEIPSHKIYEDDHVLAFLDIGPLSRGHTLVIPKQAVKTVGELSDE